MHRYNIKVISSIHLGTKPFVPLAIIHQAINPPDNGFNITGIRFPKELRTTCM
jgi:hypothetical protein